MESKYILASSSWDDREYQAINEVITQGVFTMGAFVKDFEYKFASFFESRYAIMVNSGSSANLLMIASLFYVKNKKIKLKEGDEIIVPAVSWSTTYTPLQQYGLKVKFVDVDINTLNFDLDKLQEAVTDQTKAILTVNLLGNSNDFSAIEEIIDGRDITVLLDNCESMGSKYKGQYTSAYSLISTYSTFFSHHISTMEGGVILTDDEEIYHILLSIRAHGWTRNLPKKNKVTGNKSCNEFEESFKFVLPGYNVRPLEMSGAIGIQQLDKLDHLLSVRRNNAEYFMKKFKDLSHIYIQQELGRSSWFGFSIILNEKFNTNDRNRLIKILNDSLIETRPIVAGNFVNNSVIKYFDYEVAGSLKNSDLVDNNGFFVGNHHYDLTNEIDRLFDVIRYFE
jgi:CDP-6-deoxy-D-xylo-4-hexulose-3-dehydrase